MNAPVGPPLRSIPSWVLPETTFRRFAPTPPMSAMPSLIAIPELFARAAAPVELTPIQLPWTSMSVAVPVEMPAPVFPEMRLQAPAQEALPPLFEPPIEVANPLESMPIAFGRAAVPAGFVPM